MSAVLVVPGHRYWRAAPVRVAYATSSLRLRMPSFVKMLLTWWAAVLRLMKRRSAISGFDSPRPTSRSTSSSLLVKMPTSPVPGVLTRSPIERSSEAASSAYVVAPIRSKLLSALLASAAATVGR